MRVAIVGGGFTGTMAAAEIARACPGAEIALVEKRPRFAAGAAYSTESSSHLLNVRARSMSAFDDAPGHFADWLESEGLGAAGTFARRRDYGRYLGEILDAVPGLSRVRDEAVAVEDGALKLRSGDRMPFDVLILAGGNFGGRLPARLGVPAVEDPWSAEGAEALARLAKQDGTLLLVGTGLTMVDVALSLDDAGFRGPMVAVSRRGLLPRPHEEPPSPPLETLPPPRLADLVRHVRAGQPWRASVDSLRPHSAALWRGFSEAERRRFLRHARPWWDVHRHRIAPPVAARIDALRAKGRLELLAGRIRSDDGEIVVALRGGGERRLRPAAAVNCTGPEGRIERVEDPLLQDLLASGAVRPDPLGIGLDVDEESRAIGADRRPSGNLYAAGPLTRGAFWEIVAVPDIRGQVRGIARAVAAEAY